MVRKNMCAYDYIRIFQKTFVLKQLTRL